MPQDIFALCDALVEETAALSPDPGHHGRDPGLRPPLGRLQHRRVRARARRPGGPAGPGARRRHRGRPLGGDGRRGGRRRHRGRTDPLRHLRAPARPQQHRLHPAAPAGCVRAHGQGDAGRIGRRWRPASRACRRRRRPTASAWRTAGGRGWRWPGARRWRGPARPAMPPGRPRPCAAWPAEYEAAGLGDEALGRRVTAGIDGALAAFGELAALPGAGLPALGGRGRRGGGGALLPPGPALPGVGPRPAGDLRLGLGGDRPPAAPHGGDGRRHPPRGAPARGAAPAPRGPGAGAPRPEEFRDHDAGPPGDRPGRPAGGPLRRARADPAGGRQAGPSGRGPGRLLRGAERGLHPAGHGVVRHRRAAGGAPSSTR